MKLFEKKETDEIECNRKKGVKKMAVKSKLINKGFSFLNTTFYNLYSVLMQQIVPSATMRPMFSFIKERNNGIELSGVEIGVSIGKNAYNILSLLPIKRLYLIDSYTEFACQIPTKATGYIDVCLNTSAHEKSAHKIKKIQ